MPALSKQQQKFFGLVHQCKKSGYKNCASKEIEKTARGMKAKDIEDFASTKHAGLPNKVKKEIEETMKKLELRKIIKEEIKNILNEKVYNFKNKVIGSIVSLTLSSDKEAKSKLEDLGPNWVIK